MKPPFNRDLVGIEVVPNAKTMRHQNGWIVNSQNCCRSSILW
jgi:hypothetical protein